jgi:ABC-type Na+ efflux pump permease subunit
MEQLTMMFGMALSDLEGKIRGDFRSGQTQAQSKARFRPVLTSMNTAVVNMLLHIIHDTIHASFILDVDKGLEEVRVQRSEAMGEKDKKDKKGADPPSESKQEEKSKVKKKKKKAPPPPAFFFFFFLFFLVVVLGQVVRQNTREGHEQAD